MTGKCCVAVFLLSLLSSFPVLAQTPVNQDFGLWGAVSFNKDITKDMDLSLSQELRTEDNARTLGKLYSTLGIDYELERWIRFGINYRFMFNRHSDGTYGQRHRVMADLKLRTYQHRFTFTYRARFEAELKTYNYTQEYGFSPATDLRNTGKVSYTLNRVYEPYLYIDFRFLLRDDDTPGFRGLDRTRSKAGVDINLAKNRELEIYFMSSGYWNVDEPKRIFVVGVEFEFGSRGMVF